MKNKKTPLILSPVLPIYLSGSAQAEREVPCAVSSLRFCSAVRCWLRINLPPANFSLAAKGMFYVDGIVYQYVAGTDYTVVAAAHSVLNRKFLAVKVRVYNTGRQSVTVKPEDVVLEDANGDRTLAAVSGAELARKMRHPYNWARYAVTPVAGGGSAVARRQRRRSLLSWSR